MVFRDKPGYSYKVRVTGSADSIRASTGTQDEATAKDVAAFVKHLRHLRDWHTLDTIIAESRLPRKQQRVTLRAAYDAHLNGTLDALIDSADHVDLDPCVTEWAREALPRYVTQVREFIKSGQRFPSGEFRRKRISAFLATLTVSGSTKRRYRTALSQFAKWLVEREIIETNPVRDVKAAKENKARDTWLTQEQAKALIDALPEPYKALEALMAGTGMEWESVIKVRRRDVDTATRKILAKGGKHIKRTVRVTEAWTWPIIAKHLKLLTPSAPLFTMKHEDALDVHHATSATLELPHTTLHDHRHTYAVNWRKLKRNPQALKNQLGHKPNSTVVERVYGVWTVDDSDYDESLNVTPRKIKRMR